MTLDRFAPSGPRTRTAHEYVRTTLRAAILEGHLAGGTRLRQTALAEELGVSTTPVREALRDLVTEGLVYFDPHRGAVVRGLELDEVREIYELRMVLEPVLVRRVVARIADEALDRAEALVGQMDDAADAASWVELNGRFHAVFAETDAGSRLSRIVAGLRDGAAAYVGLSLRTQPDQMRRANQEHRRMVALCRARDAEALAQLTVDHLRSTLTVVESAEPGAVEGRDASPQG